MFGLFSLYFLGWVEIKDSKVGYMIQMPDQPIIKEDSLDAGIGMTYTKTMSCSLGEGNKTKIFLANHTTYPEYLDLNDKDSTGYYLIQTIIEQVSAQLENAHLLYNSPAIINDLDAQIATIQYGTDSSLVRMALIYNKNKLMSLQFYTAFETGMDKEAEKFFYSYQLLN